jgi:hypothetical protein
MKKISISINRIAETPEGPARVCFTERNSFGVLDHSVTRPQGTSVYVPLRVIAREKKRILEAQH